MNFYELHSRILYTAAVRHSAMMPLLRLAADSQVAHAATTVKLIAACRLMAVAAVALFPVVLCCQLDDVLLAASLAGCSLE
jgi:hypothetical protein